MTQEEAIVVGVSIFFLLIAVIYLAGEIDEIRRKLGMRC